MIKKILLNLAREKIYKNFFEIMGYMEFSKKKNTFLIKTYKSFSKSVNYFIKLEKLSKDNSILLILNLIKIRIALLDGNLNNAKKYLNITNNLIFKIQDDDMLIPYKDIFIFMKDSLSLEVDIINWVLKVEDRLKPINDKVEENRQTIKEMIRRYNGIIINSPEHLVIAKKHLECVVENSLLSNEIGLKKNNSLYEEGEVLLYKIEMFRNKLISCNFVKLENNNLLVERNKLFHSVLYSRALSEKIKIEFYLGIDKKDLFDEISKIVKIQLDSLNDDPLGFIFDYTVADEIYEMSPYSKQFSFNNYIKSYIIEIHKNKKQTAFFNLKQMSNFIAENKNERIKVIEV